MKGQRRLGRIGPLGSVLRRLGRVAPLRGALRRLGRIASLGSVLRRLGRQPGQALGCWLLVGTSPGLRLQRTSGKLAFRVGVTNGLSKEENR
ncbi:hypothetical protein [Paenibacillus thiaminolyticus]|uniref:hypothetical protein n=1 Tax=Paenibacillus thiaminolyticus TaxID=49283 RepID=UPI0025435A7E|nr:hypothetical protein [Paenibacillus thiaminolyticus]WII39293.1 hypothetical protein O0V01_09450 [Paenibacillus thiaminolyticus]